jgi:ribose transport system substrate-binding protein
MLAFWVAQQILDGQTVAKDLTLPTFQIRQGDLEATLANTEKGGIANTIYIRDDAKKLIAGMK